MAHRQDGPRLRAWGGVSTTALAFPTAALVAAVLVFATADVSAGLVGGLLVALLPWALLAGDVRVGSWTMVLAGVGIPAAVVLRYDATGATFLAMLAVAWVAAQGRSPAAEVTALVGAVAIPIADVASNQARYRGNAWVFLATGSLLSWFVGRILRRERELVGALTEAQAHLHDAAAAGERQRIAREVHDVVGHSLTVMLLNLMGARRVLNSDPGTAAEALERAERVGRDSLDSVRAVVGLLRAPGDDGAAPGPAPGAADIAALARTATDAGLSVHVEVEGDLDLVDAYAGLAAFRLVQEAISNVEHHAPKAEVLVRLRNDGERLAVSVQNGPTGDPANHPGGGGTGLVSMRERITALGGTFSAGPDDEGWRVDGSIPLQRSERGALGWIRVLVVDDQELVRAGLRLILSTEDDFDLVGEAADGRAGVSAARALRPDVVLMDIRMPVLDGIGATQELLRPPKDGERCSAVLALTTFEDDEVVWGVIEAGAAGFVLKDAPASDLVTAIRVTARGGCWLDPRVASRVLAVLRRGPPTMRAGSPTIGQLSERELEVLRLVARGATNGEIAEALYLSERTVKGHISAIFTKLGVRDRAAAIVRAYDAGVVTPGQ